MSKDNIVEFFPLRGDSGAVDSEKERDRPVVYTDEQPREVLQNMLKVLDAANDPPIVFSRVGQLVGLALPQEGEPPRIVPQSKRRLFRLLIEAADWRKRTAGGDVPSSPPSRILDAILEEPGQGIPELDAVTTIPVFGKDFELINHPGYHEGQQTYFHDVHGLTLQRSD